MNTLRLESEDSEVGPVALPSPLNAGDLPQRGRFHLPDRFRAEGDQVLQTFLTEEHCLAFPRVDA